MAHILIMPRQGNTVESCIITNWKVKEGDNVSGGTTVCEVETDKAAFEVPAGADGTVLKLLFSAGDDVPVLKPIAVIGTPGEDWQAAISQENPHKGTQAVQAERQDAKTASAENKTQTELPPSLGACESRFEASSRDEFPEKALVSSHDANSETPISPRARKLAEKEKLKVAFSGSGPGGRIIERDVTAALLNRPALTAAAKAVCPGGLPTAGSGIGGRITLKDITSLPSPHSPSPDEGSITETSIKGIRKIIADRMLKSLAESAQLTLNASASAVKLLDTRSRFKAEGGSEGNITINDLILFAVSRTLPGFLYMNAHKTGDTIKTFKNIHLALAVDTPRGLMVPVIRNASRLSVLQISSEAKRLASACQSGTINPDELSGSTFTVTNLGGFGITGFTPVLNAPEVAILGVCCIEMKPVAKSVPITFEPQIGFSLTINHQAVDGAPAARFLKALGEAVKDIDLLLKAG